jgi:hypothetical protein
LQTALQTDVSSDAGTVVSIPVEGWVAPATECCKPAGTLVMPQVIAGFSQYLLSAGVLSSFLSSAFIGCSQ